MKLRTARRRRVWTPRVGRFRTWCRGLGAAACAVLPLVGTAQVQRTELSVSANATATDNGGASGAEQSDLILAVTPRLQFNRQGAGIRIAADLQAGLITSMQDTQRDRILPSARITGQATLVDRLLFVDADASVAQAEADPFAGQTALGIGRNAVTVARYRVSPRASYETASGLSVLARYAAAAADRRGSSEGDVRSQEGLGRIELRPRPLGAALEWSSQRTEYAAAATPDLRLDRWLATLNLALADDWVVGAAAGRERSGLAGSTETDVVRGLRVLWAPGPRTALAAAVDRRFFGTGWTWNASHRTPRMSFTLKTSREPLAALDGGGMFSGGLAAFLDAILTTRTPDADARRGVVEGLVATRGLQTALPGAADAAADYAQLRTSTEFGWVYLGARTTLSATIFSEQLRRLARGDTPVVQPSVVGGDRQQRGASVGWNHRLAPQLSLDTAVNWSRTEGLAARDGDRTTEGSVRAGIVRNLGPRSNLSVGLQWRKVASNVGGVAAFDESSAFAGVTHRF